MSGVKTHSSEEANAMRRSTLAAAVGLALFAVSLIARAQTYAYRLNEISHDFPGTPSGAQAINDSGYVTGHGEPCQECRGHKAFLWIGQPSLTYISGAFADELGIFF